MNEGAVIAMLVPAGAATCCLVADPQRREVRVWLPGAVMMLAMIDTALGQLGLPQTVPGVAWTLLLIAVALGSMLPTSGPARSEAARITPMAAHRALVLIAMASLTAIAGSPLAIEVGDHGHSAGMLGAAVGLSLLTLLSFAVWLCRQNLPGSGVAAVEPVAATVSLVVMALGHVVGA